MRYQPNKMFSMKSKIAILTVLLLTVKLVYAFSIHEQNNNVKPLGDSLLEFWQSRGGNKPQSRWSHVTVFRRELVAGLVSRYTVDWGRQLTRSPWTIAAGWLTNRTILPEHAPELGKWVADIGINA